MRSISEQSNGIWFAQIARRSKPVNVGRTIQSALVVDSEATLSTIVPKLRRKRENSQVEHGECGRCSS